MRSVGGGGAKFLREGGVTENVLLFQSEDSKDDDTVKMHMMAMCLSVMVTFGQESSIVFLSRSNNIAGTSIDIFRHSLGEVLSEKYRRVFRKCEFSNVHKFKGKEADVVVLLGADEWQFSSVHKKAKYFNIFQSDEEILEEAKRLFYVAVTRPKHRLILVSVKQKTLKPFALNFENIVS